MLHETQQAAEQLAGEGIDAEVIDLATIKPIDMQTILESVGRTGRCVIVQEAARTCSVSAEIAARLAEEGLMSLFAPIRRVTGYDTVMPMFRLEGHYMPDTARIVQAARQTLEFA
jgi:pyruvate dehydrogenase E1 component beta subunit